MDRARLHEGIRRMRFADVLGRTERSGLSQMEAAELLGIGERTLYRKIGTFSSGPLLTLEPRSFLRPRRADSARRFAACPFTDFLVKDVSAKKLVIAQGRVYVQVRPEFALDRIGGATGAITGTVQDPSGAVVAGADVKITNQNTGVVTRSTKTDSNGSFTATLLPVGTYTVSVSSTGFREAKFPDIAVRVTETTRMTAKLIPLQVLEKVEVEAQVQAVDTTTATTGQAIEARTIRELPLATQNFQQLLTLSTGAQSELNASAQLGRGNVRVIVNGQREDNNNYLIEGISATDYNVAQGTNIPLPNPDVIGEFKVQTSLYDASQGRNGGGNVNAILKSGTKTFHGDVYEFFRNDKLNANEYFLNRAGQPRPAVKQNIFGGSLGGPIGKDAQAGFFFVNYQGTRQRSGLSPGTLISTSLPILPTDRSADNLAAIFSTPVIGSAWL